MLRYAAKKSVQSLCTILVVSFLTFLLLWLMPGDAATLSVDLSSGNVNTQSLDIIREQYDLKSSILEQYIHWLTKIFHGDFGMSSTYHCPVFKVVPKHLAVTVRFGLMSLVLSTCGGIALAYIAATHRGTICDDIICSLSGLGVSTPPFLIAIILILVFSTSLGWLPVQGYTEPNVDYALHLKKMIMPCMVAAFGGMATVIRQTRASVLDVLNKDYVRAAKARGLLRKDIALRYIIRNALTPVLTLLGLQICVLFGGIVVVENIFNIPGMGSLLLTAVKNRDVALVQICVLIMAVAIIVSSLLVDIAYGIADPRMRQSSGEE